MRSASLKPASTSPLEKRTILATFDGFVGFGSTPAVKMSSWRIGAGDDRLDPGERRRLCGIDADDAGVRMGAALDAAPQHPRHHHVGAEIGPAGDLVDPVRTDRPGADDLEGRLVEITHAEASPLITAAASSTARMILS